MNYLRLAIIGLPLLLVLACSQQTSEEEIRAIVRSEVMAVISEVKQGPPGEQGPLPSNEHLADLIQKTALEMKEELRGPQGPRGEQGSQGTRGPQGIPGTAQLSQSDRATLSRVHMLESDLSNLRSEIECEVGGSFLCHSSLHGFLGSTIDSRITSLEEDTANFDSRITSLRNDVDNLRSEVKCEITGGFLCSSSLHGMFGSTIGSRISSLEDDLSYLQSIVNQLQRNAHTHRSY